MRQIKPINNHGSIQLKFTVSGRRYSFNPIPGAQYSNKRDLATVQAIATRINNDILSGSFDPTLDRYRSMPKAATDRPKTLLALWDMWVDHLAIPKHTLMVHYQATRKMIEQAKPGFYDTAFITKSGLKAATLKDRIGLLRACFKWAVGQGFADKNPWIDIKPPKTAKPAIKPFTKTEIGLILDGFSQRSPHYLSFVEFLLATGARTGEAIGLTWDDVDLEAGTVTIRSSLSIDRTGNGYTRIRKETKTGSIRVLPLTDRLRAILGTPSTSLVFKSPTGKAIDPKNWRARHWKPILEAVGVPYRKPYTTRHTMISHAIDQNIPLTEVAYIAGHSDTRMVMTTYGHMIDRPTLPSIL